MTDRKPPKASATDKMPPRGFVFTRSHRAISGHTTILFDQELLNPGLDYTEMLSKQESDALVDAARAEVWEEAYRLMTTGDASPSGLLVRAHRAREKIK